MWLCIRTTWIMFKNTDAWHPSKLFWSGCALDIVIFQKCPGDSNLPESLRTTGAQCVNYMDLKMGQYLWRLVRWHKQTPLRGGVSGLLEENSSWGRKGPGNPGMNAGVLLLGTSLPSVPNLVSCLQVSDLGRERAVSRNRKNWVAQKVHLIFSIK